MGVQDDIFDVDTALRDMSHTREAFHRITNQLFALESLYEDIVHKGKITRIHVNKHVIQKNRVTGENKPVLTVKSYNSNTYAHEVEIVGVSRVIYRPDSPLSCGAHVWIETQSEVKLIK